MEPEPALHGLQLPVPRREAQGEIPAMCGVHRQDFIADTSAGEDEKETSAMARRALYNFHSFLYLGRTCPWPN
jgi:hypothetical protein